MERIFPPTRYDTAPYKTICKVKGEENTALYIQLNDDESNPQWMSIGDFLEKALNYKINDPDFIDECIKNYYGNKCS